MIKLVWLGGRMADASQLEDDAEMVVRVHGGPHSGHTAIVSSAKHNCGGYSAGVFCSCGAEYTAGEEGCWQHGHQYPESGDPSLGRLLYCGYAFEGPEGAWP